MEKAKTTENGSRRKLYSVVESEQSLIDGQEQYNTLLRSRRLDLGLTMQQVAKLAGISLAQYQKFEYGLRPFENCRMLTGLKVCAALELDPYELLSYRKTL